MQVYELTELIVGNRRVMVRANQLEQKRAELESKMGVTGEAEEVVEDEVVEEEPVAEEPVADALLDLADEPQVVEKKRRGRK